MRGCWSKPSYGKFRPSVASNPPKTMIRITPILIVAVLCFASIDLVQAQDLHPSRRPSPIGIAKTHIGDTYVKVTYGRPYMRDRQIFGMNTDSVEFLTPYHAIWRTGANEATEITTTGQLSIAGNMLAAGTYSIFTEPGPSEWVIHFSPFLGLDGTGLFNAETQIFTEVYDPDQDVLEITVPSGTLEETVDQLTMVFEAVDGGAHLVLRWEKTEVRIPMEER